MFSVPTSADYAYCETLSQTNTAWMINVIGVSCLELNSDQSRRSTVAVGPFVRSCATLTDRSRVRSNWERLWWTIVVTSDADIECRSRPVTDHDEQNTWLVWPHRRHQIQASLIHWFDPCTSTLTHLVTNFQYVIQQYTSPTNGTLKS